MTRHHHRGSSLIEALVSLLLLSFTLVATVRLQTWMRQHGDLARERSEAVRQAQQAIEEQRGPRDLATFDRLPPVHTTTELAPTTYRLDRSATIDQGLKTQQVTVRWLSRSSGEQTLQLASSDARLAPAYTALQDIPPQDHVLSLPRPWPAAARTLADGSRTLVRPTPSSAMVWVIDNASGAIVAQCRLASSLHEADLAACEPFSARLLRGYIRFALSPTPDPLHANDAPLALAVQAGDRRCDTETIAADGQRYIAYACAAQTDEAQPTLVPHGWALGLDAASFKVCRYPSGAHAPKNYLVVRGDIACPSGVPPHNGAPVVTVQHQP